MSKSNLYLSERELEDETVYRHLRIMSLDYLLQISLLIHFLIVFILLTFCKTVSNYSHANKGYYHLKQIFLSFHWPTRDLQITTHK